MGARKPLFTPRRLSQNGSRKLGSTRALALSTPVSPSAATAVAVTYAYRCQLREMPNAIFNLELRRPPRSMVEVLKTGRLPKHFVGYLLARFCLTGPVGIPLLTDLQKGGGVHAFLGRLIAKAVPVQGLAELTFLWVDPD